MIEQPGVRRGEELVSSAELTQRARRAATGLAAAGVGTGDTIAILMRNDHAFFEASIAASLLGAAPVPVNWHGTAGEVRFVLEDSKAKMLVGHADLLRPLLGDLPADRPLRGVPTPPDIGDPYRIPKESWEVPEGVEDWARWLEGFEPYQAETPAGLSSMIYTSGTTGKPKGVRRLPPAKPDTSPEAAKAVAFTYEAVGIAQGMRFVVTGPMYHTAPNSYALTAFRMGGFIVLQVRFDPEELLRLVEEHRITHLHMVPTMFVRLLQLPDEVRSRYDLSSLRAVVHAAAPCPQHVKRAMIDWWGPIIREYYGGTESGAVVACDSEEWLAHPGTVGKTLPRATVKIFDDNGNELSPGEPGEVYMRLGGFPDFTYEGRPEARAEIERDGLITCGDIGYLDDDGFLYLCDRKRDMVISGGVNIYPAEIEACLLAMPGVRDVAVFGIPDEEFGEALAAVVEPHDNASLTADAVRAHVAADLARYKVPKVVEFVDALPREDSGKVFKRKLREPYWAEAGRNI